MIRANRHRRAKPVATWAGASIALAVHAALIATVHVGTAAAFGNRPRPATGIETGCVTDVALASGARIALCFAPWHSDLAACLDDAQMRGWVELASCQPQRDGDIAQVSVVDTDQLRSIDPTPLLAALPDRNQPEPKPPEPDKPPPPQAQRPSQVVETAKPQHQKAPDNARFLAEYDTSVAKQTVARGAVSEAMVANSKPSALAPKQSPQDASARNQGPMQAPNAGLLAMRSPGARSSSESAQVSRERGSVTGASGSPTADGMLPKQGQGAIEQHRRDGSESAPGMGGAPGPAAAPNLKPTADVLERAVGGGSVDHLEDVETGDATALSAKRWVYATFFNRLKRQVAQNWDPASVWRRADPSGQVYGLKTRITEVRVSLSTAGQLAKIVVTTPSGVGDLDDEALRAFRAAGPFPNPPQDLAGADHLITFAFAFYFEIGAPRTSWRVLRSM